jgi:anti-anti-sigma factor
MDSEESVAVYKFGEKIFHGNADAVTAVCGKYFIDPKIRTIVFDLENVRLCDSYGLRFLINSQRKASALDKKLLLYRPDLNLRSTLSITRLEHIFMIVEKLPA